MMTTDEKKAPTKQESNEQKTNPLEITVTIVSVAIILMIIGFLVWEGLKPTVPVTIAATPGQARQADGKYYLPMKLENRGTESAREVKVKVTLRNGEEVVEEAEATTDWLPGKSSHEPTVVLTQNPAAHQVQAEVVGFDSP